MTPDEIAQLIALGHETPGVEFKGPCARTDKPQFAKIVRAVLGMANRRDGGKVIIGVGEEGPGKRLVPTGLTEEQLITWEHDGVISNVGGYADPFVTLSTRLVQVDSSRVVVLLVEGFADVPVLCTKDYQDVLRQGACYVRRRDRIETSEIPTHAEMRELIDLATEKGIRKFLQQVHRVGITANLVGATPDDADQFERQRGEFR